MKLSVTTKLVLVMLLSGATLVTAMAFAMRWSFQKGFVDYLSEVEWASLESTRVKLALAYRESGSWQFLRGNHRAWASFLPFKQAARGAGSANHAPPEHGRFREPPPPPHWPPPPDGSDFAGRLHPPGPDGFPPPGPPPEDGFGLHAPRPLGEAPPGHPPREFGNHPPPAAPDDRTGLSTRIRLLDADKRRIIGPPKENGRPEMRAVAVNGKTVGWLSLTPLQLPASDLDRSFLDEQLRALYPIAGGALLLSLLFGIPMGRHLLRPIKAIAGGARRLAMGRYETRVQAHGADELGQLAADFNALAETLQQNERLRRENMADVSHELRTPVGLLRGEIEAIQDGIRPLNRERLNTLHHSVMRLSRLVDDLYDLALADAGALSYRKTEVDLADILEQAVAAARMRCEECGLDLTLQVDGPLPTAADPRRMRQVFDNLLTNSRRYTDNGGRISVRAGRRDGRAIIEVDDSAPGVDADALAKLFQRFYRVEASRNRAGGGAGLGLPICRNIVAAHQGAIAALPSRLGGLRIVVEIPTVG